MTEVSTSVFIDDPDNDSVSFQPPAKTVREGSDKSDYQKMADGEVEDEGLTDDQGLKELNDKEGKPEKAESEVADEQEGDAEPEGDEDETKQASSQKEDEEKTPPWLKKRLAEMAKQKHAAYEAEKKAERRAAEAEKKAALLEEKLAALEMPELKRPKRDDFDDDDGFIEALTDYKLEMKLREERKRNKKPDDANPNKDIVDQHRERQSRIGTMLQEGEKAYRDFRSVVDTPEMSKVVNDGIVDAILGAENGHKILYYLGNNIEEAYDIASLPPNRILLSIGRLDAELSQETKPKIQPPPKPSKPLKTRAVVQRSPSDMTTEEYREYRGYTRDGMRKDRI